MFVGISIGGWISLICFVLVGVGFWRSVDKISEAIKGLNFDPIRLEIERVANCVEDMERAISSLDSTMETIAAQLTDIESAIRQPTGEPSQKG